MKMKKIKNIYKEYSIHQVILTKKYLIKQYIKNQII